MKKKNAENDERMEVKMPETDGVEIAATMQSLVLLLNQVVRGDQAATPQYMDYFVLKLKYLDQFARNDTKKRLQRISQKITQAKAKLQKGAEDEFYTCAEEALQEMRRIREKE